jgi:hypothetical protein
VHICTGFAGATPGMDVQCVRPDCLAGGSGYPTASDAPSRSCPVHGHFAGPTNSCGTSGIEWCRNQCGQNTSDYSSESVRAVAARRPGRYGAGPPLDSAALRQAFGRRSKARHQRFDFRRDLRFIDEQKRSIVEQEFASESLSASAELDLISPEAFGIERWIHGPSAGCSRTALLRPSSAWIEPPLFSAVPDELEVTAPVESESGFWSLQ